MKKYIVITSIFEPTEAVISFSKMSNFKLVVVGDLKTPTQWHCENVEYISIGKQDTIGKYLNRVLPYNHYSRKMLGYLHAMNNGADQIIDTDDDNIPNTNWGFPPFEAIYPCIPGGKGFVNIYQLYTDQHIWPRGLPLRLIQKDFDLEISLQEKSSKVGIWQGLADGDPDVDAIYRLTSNQPCNFKLRNPVVLGKGTVTPFNTQNTIIRKELFPLMYLPTFATFRFTDILRGLVAQPIMNLYNYHLGFINATVTQVRNPHDYYLDFLSEIPMYHHVEKVIDIAGSIVDSGLCMEDNLFNVYAALKREKIVEERELIVLRAWLDDLPKAVD